MLGSQGWSLYTGLTVVLKTKLILNALKVLYLNLDYSNAVTQSKLKYWTLKVFMTNLVVFLRNLIYFIGLTNVRCLVTLPSGSNPNFISEKIIGFNWM